MSDPLLWALIAVQMVLGAFDIVYHHEATERLAWRATQARELRLHGLRNLLYAAIFATLGWLEPHGLWAVVLAAVLVVEVVVTLWDFVEEDRSRRLPASERVAHGLLALNYGAILALLLPLLLDWSAAATALVPARHGIGSLLLSIAAVGTLLFGLRDFAAAARLARRPAAPAAALAEGLPGRRHVLVTGGTGLVGSRLIAALLAAGQRVTLLTRDPAKATGLGTPLTVVTDLDQIPDDAAFDAIVNLAGEPLADGLWTRTKRRRILRSRLVVSRGLLRLVARLEQRPEVLVSASALGWYGVRDDTALTEDARPGHGFGPRVCLACEREAIRAEAYGLRVVRLRIGLVLAVEDGLLGRLLPVYEYGLGGPMGDGRQWMSWIARDDLVRLIVHAIAHHALRGAVNATAPQPVRNADFAKALGRALGRPAVLRAPAGPLRALCGDLARELLLGGQRVLPAAAERAGFRFRHRTLDGALAAILGGRGDNPSPAPAAPGPRPDQATARRSAWRAGAMDACERVLEHASRRDPQRGL